MQHYLVSPSLQGGSITDETTEETLLAFSGLSSLSLLLTTISTRAFFPRLASACPRLQSLGLKSLKMCDQRVAHSMSALATGLTALSSLSLSGFTGQSMLVPAGEVGWAMGTGAALEQVAWAGVDAGPGGEGAGQQAGARATAAAAAIPGPGAAAEGAAKEQSTLAPSGRQTRARGRGKVGPMCARVYPRVPRGEDPNPVLHRVTELDTTLQVDLTEATDLMSLHAPSHAQQAKSDAEWLRIMRNHPHMFQRLQGLRLPCPSGGDAARAAAVVEEGEGGDEGEEEEELQQEEAEEEGFPWDVLTCLPSLTQLFTTFITNPPEPLAATGPLHAGAAPADAGAGAWASSAGVVVDGEGLEARAVSGAVSGAATAAGAGAGMVRQVPPLLELDLSSYTWSGSTEGLMQLTMVRSH